MKDDKTVIIGKPFRIAPGTRLNGIYEVESLIGVGGMSEIYKGRNIQTLDDVAIKVILPEFAQDEQMVKLFRREALTLNRLSNESIVRYHVFSHDPAANLLYLAMEFVDGPTLRDSMKQRPLSQQEACLLISKVAAGMLVAHSEGIVHRDLSTDNIILAGNSVTKPKVIDFGIARSSEFNDSTLLSSGFAGKYNFVSPEQLGLFGGKVEESSDIYSLGLVFAAALLGRPLDMAGSHADVVMKRQGVPDLSMINPGVRPLIESMLQPRPSMRPQSMGEIVEALEKWLPARGEQTLRGSRPARTKLVALAGSAAPAEIKSRVGGVWSILLLISAGLLAYGATQTDIGRELAAKAVDNISALSNGAPVSTPTPPAAEVNPDTGKSEIKAGDPVLAAERSTETAKPERVETEAKAEVPAVSAEIPKFKGEAAKPEPATPDVAEPTADVPAVSEQTAAETITAKADEGTVPVPSLPESGPQSPTPSTRKVSADNVPEVSDNAGLADGSPPVSDAVDAADSNVAVEEPSQPVPEAESVAAPPKISIGEASPAAAGETVSPPDSGGEVKIASKVSPAPAANPGSGTPKSIESSPPIWIAQYDGGSCFHATGGKMVDGKVRIEGFGAKVEPFERLDKSFKSKFGVEPQIRLRAVTTKQCPVIDFANQTRSDMTLSLQNDLLGAGEPLEAKLSGVTEDNVSVFVVTPDGIVVNVTSLSNRFDNEIIVQVPNEALASKAGSDYLLFAIASDEPLAGLDLANAADPRKFLAELAVEAQGARIMSAVKYLRKK